MTGWFIKGTFPEPPAFYALLSVLKWPPEKLMRLTGYEEMPPRVLSEWDYLRDKIEHEPLPAEEERARWLRLLEQWKAEYVVQPRTPPRRTMARKKALKAGSAAATTSGASGSGGATAETSADERPVSRQKRPAESAGK